MRRYLRPPAPGAALFFTLALQDRTADTLVRHADDLRVAIAAVRARHPFRIDAMVVLPDHLHAIWTLPPDDGDFARRWMLVKQGWTKRLSAVGALAGEAARMSGAGERSLWQRRFWEHRIRDAHDLANHVNYVHFNPVKHGWVQRVRDWPHSSFHRYVREGRLPVDWGLAAGVEGRYGE